MNQAIQDLLHLFTEIPIQQSKINNVIVDLDTLIKHKTLNEITFEDWSSGKFSIYPSFIIKMGNVTVGNFWVETNYELKQLLFVINIFRKRCVIEHSFTVCANEPQWVYATLITQIKNIINKNIGNKQ